MQVKAIRPRGYCKGVVRAIEMAKQARGEKQPVVILGMIVHNQYIVDALKQMGIETIDYPGKTRLELLDEIQEGTVIITAHGAGDQVFEKARAKGLNVIDASCLDVIKTHELIKEKLSKGYEILYIGKKGHPEAEGAVSIDAERIHLIGSKEDLKALDPGADYVNDSSKWDELEIMVKDIISTYKDDDRILMWCLYNEPENHRRGVTNSVPLMEATFRWARECHPSQPLTAPLWREVGVPGTSLPEVTFALENSDVISFHCYSSGAVLEKFIKSLLSYTVPIVSSGRIFVNVLLGVYKKFTLPL